MAFQPSVEQAAILEAVRTTHDNLLIAALAGTGKTTTLVEIAKQLPAQGSKLFCAFNKDIVSELERRLAGTGVRTQTFHSIGFSALKKHLGVKDLTLDGNKYRAIIQAWAEDNTHLMEAINAVAEEVGEDGDQENRAKRVEQLRKDLLKDTIKMAIDLCAFTRYKLVEWDDFSALGDLVQMYRMDDDIFNDERIITVVVEAVPTFMSVAENQTRNLLIDFTDMIYWVVRWDAKMYQFNYVLVDESQDLSPMQRALIAKALWRTGRIFLVGDKFQAIYAFAGADSDSFDLSREQFNCTVMPLTVTRRCARIVTEHAARLVPPFQCLPDKPRGKIVWIDEERMVEVAKPGDMILCRVRAPLVAGILEFLAAGVPATILGSEIGKSLTALLEKLQKRDDWNWDKRLDVLAAYEEAEVERFMKKGDEAGAEGVKDRVAGLRVIMERSKATTVDELIYEIEKLFSDGNTDGKVILSTIHKSKGLEADRVFILKPEKLPLMFPGLTAEASQQETNLDYVARTRAKSTVVYLTNDRFLRDNHQPPYVQLNFDDQVWPTESLPAPKDDVIEGTFEVISPMGETPALPPPVVYTMPRNEAVKLAVANGNDPALLDEALETIKPVEDDALNALRNTPLFEDDSSPAQPLKPVVIRPVPNTPPAQRLQALIEQLQPNEIDTLIALLQAAKAERETAHANP